MITTDPMLQGPPQEELDEYFNWSTVSPRLNQLIDSWSTEVELTDSRRNLRYIDVDVDALRQEGKIQADETFIPVRVIDTNISREDSVYTAYLTQSRRLLVLDLPGVSNDYTDRLESEVTRGLRYKGWLTEFHRVRDGAAMHGWDAMEVVFDLSKPLHVGFEHIGHDRLYFDRNVHDIQDSEYVVIKYNVTGRVLKELAAENMFNPDQVNLVLEGDSNGNKRLEAKFDLYKGYFKFDGIVYVCWFVKGLRSEDWIKAPEPLYLGISHIEQQIGEGSGTLATSPEGGIEILPPQPVPVEVDDYVFEYPIHLLYYKETEEKEVFSKVGRCFLDSDWQEAQTSIVTSFVNKLKRSSNVYAAPATDTEEADMRQLDVVLENGKIFSKPLTFFSQQPPESIVLQSLNYLDSANSQRAGQVDYAALNRKDSRKTATEMTAAKEEAAQNKATPIALFSDFLRGIFTITWKIVQSRALLGKIPLLLDESGNNNVNIIGLPYEVHPAGDVDVIARQEKINQMMQDWPVISQTSLSTKFLADLMRLKYPDEGEQYAQIITENPSGGQLVMALSSMLQTLVKPEDVAALPPEQQQQLANLQQQVQQFVGGNK